MAAAVLPLIDVELTRPWSREVFCVDAAPRGLAASHSRWALRSVCEVGRLEERWRFKEGRDDAGVRAEELRGGIGSLSPIAGALESERPFLAPLYSFSSRAPHQGFVTLPLYVKLVLLY